MYRVYRECTASAAKQTPVFMGLYRVYRVYRQKHKCSTFYLLVPL